MGKEIVDLVANDITPYGRIVTDSVVVVPSRVGDVSFVRNQPYRIKTADGVYRATVVRPTRDGVYLRIGGKI